MKIGLLSILLCMASVMTLAQQVIISGTVYDESSGSKIAQAIITIPGTNISIVTNDDGIFTLKTEQLPPAIQVSHIGYRTRYVEISGIPADNMLIKLTPATIVLKEVTIQINDPEELVRQALKRIPQNYPRVPELHKGFYRETAMKRQNFIYVAEGVIDMYKTDYLRDVSHDQVAIVKGRRLMSTKASDTLGVKVMGGPLLPIRFDVVKNRDLLFSSEEMVNYKFHMEQPVTIKDRPQLVVGFSPKVELPYPLFKGLLYIDRENLAITRAEFSLDVSDRAKATRYMLASKPVGVRFNPKGLSFLIDYHYENGMTRFCYVRSTFRFNCDWKRRFFATSYTVSSEMVVTDRMNKDVKPIKGRDTFDSHDSFYDRVDYFLDPDFWEDYNIIEPTETLDRSIGRLLKHYVQ